MRNATIRFLILMAICLVFPVFVSAQSVQSIKKAPDVSLTDLKNKTVKLKDLKGKIVLLNFWATWCAPCLAEIPELVKWQKEYANQGLQIIGITYPPTSRAKVRRFARRNKINYPILFGSTKTKELFDSGETMPFSVVIDKDGNVKDVIEGIIFADEFDEKVKPLFKPDSDKKVAGIQKKTKK